MSATKERSDIVPAAPREDDTLRGIPVEPPTQPTLVDPREAEASFDVEIDVDESPSADDTAEQPALRPALIKRRASGPRKRLTLATDGVRDAIEARFREEGQWRALVELYLNRLDVSEDATEKVELLKRTADVLVRELNEPAQAFDALLEALSLAPKDDETAASLEEVARKLARWPVLVQEVKGRFDAEGDPDRQLRWAELLTRWYRIELSDPEGAQPFLDKIRALDPGHPLVHKRLASVYAEVGAWDAQRDALERALLSARRDADRKGFHLALGEIHETRSKDLEKATEHYEAALALEPASMEALLGLERICRMREDFGGLLHVLERQADRATEDEARLRALMRLAELHERSFLKPQAAAPRLEAAFELAGADESARFAALDGLERCYHAMRAWQKLVSTLERRAAMTKNVLERCDLLMRVAEVWESKLKDTELAMEAYRRVCQADDGHRRAIHELARLSEKQHDWTGAAAYRSRAAELVDDARARAQAHFQIGEMLLPDDRDPSSARLHFEKAVALDPSHAGAWEALRAMATRAGDGMHAVYCLERRAERTESPRLKAQLLVELARMKTALGDQRGAFATFDWAVRTDPSNEVAARSVFDDYVRAERWAEAQPVCDVLINVATREGDKDTLFALLRVSTRIAVAVGAEERALMAALAAFEMRPTDAAAREAVIAACHALRTDGEVRARTRATIARLAAASAELGPDALVQLAQIRRAGGDEANAVETLLRALTLDAEHVGALTTLIESFSVTGDWARAAGCKQRLALAERDPARQRALLLDAAELWETHAKNPAKATLLVEQALEMHPGDAAFLHKLVALCGTMQLWDKLLDTLRTIADAEMDPARRAKSVLVMAGVMKDKIGNTRGAALLYEEVLDLDHSRLDAFEKVVRIWTELREWNELRGAYVKMLSRAKDADADLKHALRFQLGLVYRDRLGDAARAVDAFRCASQLKPESDEDRKAVVELYVVMDQLDMAVAALRAHVRRDPLRAAPYRELCEVFLRAGANDKAWCAVDALAHLGEASPDELSFLHSYLPVAVEEVPGTLAPSAWASHVVHPELDVRLSSILRIVTPAILRMRMTSLPEPQRKAFLGRRIQEKDSELAARVVCLVQNACEILGVVAPPLYDRPKMPVPMSVAPTEEPALFVSLPAFEATPQDLLPFVVGRRIGEIYPELTAHALFPTVGELKSLLKASVRIALATGTKNGMEKIKPDEQRLSRVMSTKELDDLREATSTVVGGAERVDIRRWLELADASLSRVGLLLTGDFETAWRAVQREARAPNDLAPDAWRGEMLSFLVSDEHADLRGAIGVGVDGPQ